MFSVPFTRLTIIALAAAGLGAASLMSSATPPTRAQLSLESNTATLVTGETMQVRVHVSSPIPVNVFAGNLTFNPSILHVAQTDYNTSIANLWAEEPWYSNGDGTLNFAGGTTLPGGFTGQGDLLTITFIANQPGDTRVYVDNIRILQYDGLGSDAGAPPLIDSLFTISEPLDRPKVIAERRGGGPTVAVTAEPPRTDLNGDGTQSTADLSIFMTDLVSQNNRSDFNNDGRVGIKDLSILLDAS